MSDKPIDVGRFAVDGDDADAANISPPSSDLRDTGFPNDYVPPAAEFNYLENIAYRWRQYLSDGALDGSHTINGNLGVSGDLTVDLDVDIGGDVGITGAGAIDGGLGVGGALAVTAAATIGSTLGVTGLITATAGLTAGANQHVTVSGTGRLKHGAREVNVLASQFVGESNTGPAVLNTSGYVTFTSGGFPMAWVPLEVGTRILTVQQFYNVNGTGTTITPSFRRINHVTGVQTDVWAGSADNTGSAIESQTSSTLNHTVLSGEAYFLQVFISSSSHRLYGATITYDCV